MLICAAIGFTIGIGFGARFKVFVLIPLQMAWGLMVAVAGAAGLISAGHAFQAFAWFCALLQAGYGVAAATPLQSIPAALRVGRPVARRRRELDGR